jgi:hypothetical protein
MQTALDLKHLTAENRALGFAEVPTSCPEYFRNRIIERRAQILGIDITIAPRPTETEQELEKWKKEMTAKLEALFLT